MEIWNKYLFGQQIMLLIKHQTLKRLARCLSTAAKDGPLQVYTQRVASGELREDPPQLAALIHLDNLHHKLKIYTPPTLSPLTISTAKTDITTKQLEKRGEILVSGALA